jgi:peptide chain release factor 1
MMFDRLNSVVERYEDLTNQMADPAVLSDVAQLQRIAREQRDLEGVVNAFRRYTDVEKQIAEAQELSNSAGDDPDLRAMAQEELTALNVERDTLAASLKLLLLPRDPNDERSVIMELRQGEGGDESALFAADLYRMYIRYAERVGWKVELLNASENGIGGYKEISLEIQGDGAYSRLKYEGGVHRVQRVPATEARGRIHTSTATVAVLPKLDDEAIDIKQEDLRIDVFRSGGHGGQGVNTTDSAVRIVYRGGTPDEMVVTCQDGRSQLKNKEKAMSVLRARLFAIKEEKRAKAVGESRLAQVGTGERAEKVRTYNFPQDRLTDHRIGQNFSNIPGLLDGDIDKLIDALIVYDNAERLRAVGVDA